MLLKSQLSQKLLILLISAHANSEMCPQITNKNEILTIVQRNILNGSRVHILKSNKEWRILRDRFNIKIKDNCGPQHHNYLNVIMRGNQVIKTFQSPSDNVVQADTICQASQDVAFDDHSKQQAVDMESLDLICSKISIENSEYKIGEVTKTSESLKPPKSRKKRSKSGSNTGSEIGSLTSDFDDDELFGKLQLCPPKNGKNSMQFCLMNGFCVTRPHQDYNILSCVCMDGWQGAHCESRDVEFEHSRSIPDCVNSESCEKTLNQSSIILMSVVINSIIVLVAIYCSYFKAKKFYLQQLGKNRLRQSLDGFKSYKSGSYRVVEANLRNSRVGGFVGKSLNQNVAASDTALQIFRSNSKYPSSKRNSLTPSMLVKSELSKDFNSISKGPKIEGQRSYNSQRSQSYDNI